MSNISHYDVIIIGAGLYGISAAKTYLEIHPLSKVIILEADSSLGGVWSSKRMYDAFWTQTPVGMAAFSDRPMAAPPEEDIYYDFFPAKYMTKYLEDYVDNHVYAYRTLRDRINFNLQVNRVEKLSETWVVRCNEGDKIFAGHKLMVATGLTSNPNMPILPNQDAFSGAIMHHKEFGQSSFLDSSDVTHVAVLGGGKSAADIVYASAKAGKIVSWIIREGGSGPAALAPPEGIGPYRNSNETLYTRLSSRMSPSIFVPSTWFTRFLHKSQPGRRFVDWIWSVLDAQYSKAANYQRIDIHKNGFHHLKPDTPIFWQNDSTGVNQRPDFWNLVATKVHVYRQNIVSLEDRNIHLKDGTAIASDVLVCATGWRPSVLSFFDASLAGRLGLPSLSGDLDPKELAKWKDLETAADRQILQQFPRLSDPPDHNQSVVKRSPFRLYKAIASLKCNSVVFLGHIAVGNNFRAAECQALWAVAYLDGKLTLPSQEDMEKEVALTVAWCKRRYLSKGVFGHWFYYDLIPYTDRLLEQISLSSHRKGWFRDFLAPCVAGDLCDLHQEYLSLFRQNEVAQGNKR